jgi:DNA-binding CsgD family transcriptional regulator
VDGTEGRAPRALLPLLLLSAAVVMVTSGLARGVWLPNLHNGLLALAFTAVGAYVLFQRPGHLTGGLFLATGAIESLIFLGRQVGHDPGAADGTWLGWLGVWPVALALGLVTLSVVCFPDGRLPSRRWAPVAVAVVVVMLALATVSAVWPVEYAAAGLHTSHPLHARTPHRVATVWSHLAHPAYAALQVLWVVVVVARWRRADALVRSQLVWLAGAAGVSSVALVIGLVGWGTPTPGLISAALIPIAAGWAVVHGQHLAAYSALTWLSRSGASGQDLPHDLARAVAQSLRAPGAVLWMGDPSELHAVGVWPETSEPIVAQDLATLSGSPELRARAVSRAGVSIGALTVERDDADPLSVAESRLLDDLAAQAALVLAHQNLAEVIAAQQRAGRLDGLSPREQVVLDLMARGLSNAAICQELHLSIKTVEPAVGAIFTKLQLQPDADSNRRVLAVLAYLRTREPNTAGDR